MQAAIKTAASAASRQASTSTAAASTSKYFLVTLNRSPAHLPKKVKASCESMGLTKRLASSIIPVTQPNAGLITSVKELVSVRILDDAELAEIADVDWATREGNGRTGSGLRQANSVIQVGTERARGEQRGYRVLS